MLSWAEYKYVRRKYFGEYRRTEIRQGWNKYKDFYNRINGLEPVTTIVDECMYIDECFKLAPLPQCEAVPCTQPANKPWPCKSMKKEQQGNTPMAYCNSTTPAKSDAQVQRDYLTGRLREVRYIVSDGLINMFNLHVNQQPKTYKELIDWIKNDKFTLDTKRTAKIDAFVGDGDWYGSYFDGIIFTGSGKPKDYDGYTAATVEMDKAYTAAMDVIVTGDAAAGLAALQKFEAFVPSNAPATK